MDTIRGHLQAHPRLRSRHCPRRPLSTPSMPQAPPALPSVSHILFVYHTPQQQHRVRKQVSAALTLQQAQGVGSRIQIPASVPGLTTRRLLVMSYMDGLQISRLGDRMDKLSARQVCGRGGQTCGSLLRRWLWFSVRFSSSSGCGADPALAADKGGNCAFCLGAPPSASYTRLVHNFKLLLTLDLFGSCTTHRSAWA